MTIEALEALAAWAGGDAAAAQTVRDAEPRGDEAKRDLLNALREAFILQLEPEDVFTLSRGLDWILDRGRDLIEEAEAMGFVPDQGIATMTKLLVQATRQIDEAIGYLGSDDDRATAAADAAIKTARQLQHAYYSESARLLELRDTRERISGRELHRQCERIERDRDRGGRANRLCRRQGELKQFGLDTTYQRERSVVVDEHPPVLRDELAAPAPGH